MSDTPTHREDPGLSALRELTRPGASYATAAESLGVTVPTIRRNLHRLYVRLGVSSAVQAVAAAWDELANWCEPCQVVLPADRRRQHRSTLRHRLLSGIRVDAATGCWEWQRYRMPNGYGKIGDRGVMLYTHRVAYEMFVGPIPAGLLVCHHCDNRRCCNPEHLFTGTESDNAQDALRKGRLGLRRQTFG